MGEPSHRVLDGADVLDQRVPIDRGVLMIRVVPRREALGTRVRYWALRFRFPVLGVLGLLLGTVLSGSGGRILFTAFMMGLFVGASALAALWFSWSVRRAVMWVMLPKHLAGALELPSNPPSANLTSVTVVVAGDASLELRPRRRPAPDSRFVPAVAFATHDLRMTVDCDRRGAVCAARIEAPWGGYSCPAGGSLRRHLSGPLGVAAP